MQKNALGQKAQDGNYIIRGTTRFTVKTVTLCHCKTWHAVCRAAYGSPTRYTVSFRLQLYGQ